MQTMNTNIFQIATAEKASCKRPRVPQLSLVLLLVLCFSLAANLGLWFQTWQGNRAESANLFAVALGDSRRLFANHFFVKADAYFHSGFYPTIYDNRQSFQTPHIAEDSGAMEGKNTGDEEKFLGGPRNWIDAFGREFFPSVHTHLTEGGANGEEKEGEVREILPWLKLSSELDPHRVQTYSVTAYWLRRINKLDEAEEFLRDGIKENPGSPELLFELGRIYCDDRHDASRARNIWEAGIRILAKQPASDENKYMAEQIMAALAKLEEHAGNTNQVLRLLEGLKALAPNPEEIQKWIERVKTGAGK